jgi:cytochrome c biogenesis protein CcmG/thiol:disulfide interchange protein DsbE
MIKRYMPILAFFVLSAFLAIGLTLKPKEVPSPLINKPAPALSLPQLFDTNKVVHTADMQGKVWLLNVWASWCRACRAEHSLLNRFSKERQTPIVGLNYKDSLFQAKKWLKQLGNPYSIIAFDNKGNAGINWGVYGVPETFVIDKKGTIRYKQIGPMDDSALQNIILPLIQQLENES